MSLSDAAIAAWHWQLHRIYTIFCRVCKQSVLFLLHKRQYGVVLQGYVVFSVEHADGTASAAQLAYGAGWLYYKGWGSEEERMAQTRSAFSVYCSTAFSQQ